jgi:DNA-binding NtrC family response regulator
MEKGLIREDFYYRIHIIPIYLPPLRERKEDIPLLIQHFLKICPSQGQQIPTIPADILEAMQRYDWPGNVRQLQNSIHRYVTLKEIDFAEMPRSKQAAIQENRETALNQRPVYPDLRTAVQNYEKDYIQKVLRDHQWHRARAASVLGVNRRTLFRKMKTYGLE